LNVLCYRFIPRGDLTNPNGVFSSRAASNTPSSVHPHPPDYLALFLEFSRDDTRSVDRPSSGQNQNKPVGWMCGQHDVGAYSRRAVRYVAIASRQNCRVR